MYEIFEQLLQKKGVTAYRICKETGISQTTISAWKNGEYTPKQEKLQKIADYFEVPLEYLLTGDIEKYQNDNMSSILKTFIDYNNNFNNEIKKIIIPMLESNNISPVYNGKNIIEIDNNEDIYPFLAMILNEENNSLSKDEKSTILSYLKKSNYELLEIGKMISSINEVCEKIKNYEA